MPEFVVLEKDAAEYAGIPRQRLKEARDGLERGHDWDLESGAVAYTLEGFQKALKAAGAPETGKEALERLIAMQSAPTEAQPPVELLVVCRIYRNSRILGARLPESGRIVRVRQRGNKPFKKARRRGFKLECVHVQEDLWEVLRGRW